MNRVVDLGKVLGEIPSESYNDLSIALMDLLLVSKKGDKIASPLVKELLHLWHKDELNTSNGLRLLLEAAVSVDPEEAGKLLASRGLREVARALGLGGQR